MECGEWCSSCFDTTTGYKVESRVEMVGLLWTTMRFGCVDGRDRSPVAVRQKKANASRERF